MRTETIATITATFADTGADCIRTTVMAELTQ